MGYLSHTPRLGTKPTTQACALTGNQTGGDFALKEDAQPTEPHQSEHSCYTENI